MGFPGGEGLTSLCLLASGQGLRIGEITSSCRWYIPKGQAWLYAVSGTVLQLCRKTGGFSVRNGVASSTTGEVISDCEVLGWGCVLWGNIISSNEILSQVNVISLTQWIMGSWVWKFTGPGTWEPLLPREPRRQPATYCYKGIDPEVERGNFLP